MQSFELMERGQSVKLTTNNTSGEDVKIYSITENNDGDAVIKDITEDNPDVKSIADDKLKQYLFNMPEVDCYILALFNGTPRYFRVGTPTVRYFVYTGKTGMEINFKLLNFDGTEIVADKLGELDLGVYYHTPDNLGDQILMIDGIPPIPVHTPYIVDAVGYSGKIIFQKNQWMLLSVPMLDTNISDLVKAIEDKYSINGEDAFRIFSAFPATGTQSKEMLDYKPNYTPNDSKYNFSLVYDDDGAKEITGFWCKTLDYTVNDDDNELIVFEWST